MTGTSLITRPAWYVLYYTNYTLLFFLLFFIMCNGVLPECKSGYQMCPWCVKMPEEGI